MEECKRQNMLQRHSEAQVAAAPPSTLRLPQPRPVRVRDPSRSRLKPEDRQRPLIMLRT